MRTIFMGTPKFAVPTLELLCDSSHQVLAVITQPDRPKGRHLNYQPSSIKSLAQLKKLPLLQPTNLQEEDLKNEIERLDPEVIVVVAYGKIIPSWILDLPRYGCINVHASLLPRYRGAAPIQRAIMDGCAETGVTTMVLDEGMDTGDILLQSKIQVGPEDTSGDVASRLADEGARLLLNTLDGLDKNCISPIVQDENKASYAPKIEKEDAHLDWSRQALELKNTIRALNPFSGAYTFLSGKRLKVFQARVSEETDSATQPGTIVGLEEDGIVVACADKQLILTVVQSENKRQMTAGEFLRGHQIRVGEQLG